MSKQHKCIFVNNDNIIHSIHDNHFINYDEKINEKNIYLLCLEGIINLGDQSKYKIYPFDNIILTVTQILSRKDCCITMNNEIIYLILTDKIYCL